MPEQQSLASIVKELGKRGAALRLSHDADNRCYVISIAGSRGNLERRVSDVAVESAVAFDCFTFEICNTAGHYFEAATFND